MTKIIELEERYLRYFKKLIKKIKLFINSNNKKKKLLFILGYGRSGTYLLLHMFEHLLYTECYGEGGNKIMTNWMLNKDVMEKMYAKSKAEMFVIKPILNSYLINEFIRNYPDANIIWMYRNYKDVVRSTLKKFGFSVGNYLKEYITYNRGDNWISNQLPYEEKSILNRLDTNNFSNEDWTALVWWSLNHVLISKKLTKHTNLMLVNYSDFVKTSNKQIKEIGDFLDINININYSKYIYSSSVGKGKHIELNPYIDQLCLDLFNKLDHVNN